MWMGIKKARQDCAALQIEAPGFRRDLLVQVSIFSHGKDFAPANGHGFANPGTVVQRNYPAVVKQQVGMQSGTDTGRHCSG